MPIAKTALALVLASTAFAGEIAPVVGETFVAHEWGTFTSVAGRDGHQVEWAPLSGPSDLPCFVARLSPGNIKGLPGTVRMETPVIYFYAQRPLTVSVHVDFPQGWITEWYPQATSVKAEGLERRRGPATLTGGRIDWDAVQVLPGSDLAYPTGKGENHYYAARKTDSAPIRIGGQQEKLIFYRGIGNLPVPLQPRFDAAGEVEIRNVGADRIPLAILFENRGGRVGYRLARDLKSEPLRLSLPKLTADLDALRRTLAGALVEFGLHEKEAAAMLETWKDSWFEEGTRVFYVVPRATVDAVLPLTITPAPAGLERVFVGRVEMLSPWGERMLKTALKDGDIATLARFGRFLYPFVMQVRSGDASLGPSSTSDTFSRAYAKLAQRDAASCVE